MGVNGFALFPFDGGRAGDEGDLLRRSRPSRPSRRPRLGQRSPENSNVTTVGAVTPIPSPSIEGEGRGTTHATDPRNRLRHARPSDQRGHGLADHRQPRSVTVPEGTLDHARGAAGGAPPSPSSAPPTCRNRSAHAVVVPGGDRRSCRASPASCTTPVAAGMTVKTQTRHAGHLRNRVMELYISDHPLDCLTCAANGDCELQDMAGARRPAGEFATATRVTTT